MFDVNTDIADFLRDLERVRSSSINVSQHLARVMADALESKTSIPAGVYPAISRLMKFRAAAQALHDDVGLYELVKECASLSTQSEAA